MLEGSDIQINQKESVKLTKNSRGYGWEIKLLSDDIEKEIERLDKINKKLNVKYGDDLDID